MHLSILALLTALPAVAYAATPQKNRLVRGVILNETQPCQPLGGGCKLRVGNFIPLEEDQCCDTFDCKVNSGSSISGVRPLPVHLPCFSLIGVLDMQVLYS